MDSRLAAYNNAAYGNASLFNTTYFSYDTRRLLDRVGFPSLSPEEMNELSRILNQMSRIYGSQKVFYA